MNVITVSLLITRVTYPLHRFYSSIYSSRFIRQTFIDYFVKDNNHAFIRSSPVMPFCDPTVPFVNAGMNQFKGIFLGEIVPEYSRVANSQKCIRVGGKHNDLNVVGTDGYHHTFFEMLGNWSFGDYFKEEACKLAWNLLTGPYGISKDRLYVTYFCGNESLGLEADMEIYEIWRKLGVPVDRILPFGESDNFWEMGPVGPCGPCTEVHIDHVPGRETAADRVNRGFADVTELWNLVFIQYNRKGDGTLEKLPSFHVDTGMGFERLVSVLQNKQSNYDTDLFLPLFSAIQQLTGAEPYRGLFAQQDTNGLDTAYRVLADHSRMITVSLADGIFPAHNLKLRRIIRKALNTGTKYFSARKGLLKELSNHVCEILSEPYPEIGMRLKQVQLILEHEEELLEDLRGNAAVKWRKIVETRPHLRTLEITEMPGLVTAYGELESAICDLKKSGRINEQGKPILPGSLMFKLYDTYGLDEDLIVKIASAEGCDLDFSGFEWHLHNVKLQSRKGSAIMAQYGTADIVQKIVESGVEPTNSSLKYAYFKEDCNYVFPSVESTIKAIVADGSMCDKIKPETECSLIFDRTNFYHEAGGQASDVGYAVLGNGSKISIYDVIDCSGYVLHKCSFGNKNGDTLSVGDLVTLHIDPDHRLANMRNHTATHLVNAALRNILTVTCQNSSNVSSDKLTFDFSVYGEHFGTNEVEKLEKMVENVIHSSIPVKRSTVSGNELHSLDGVTLVPGEVYPEHGIHLIEVEAGNGFTSREPCCGTHVLNTADISAFCVVALESSGSGSRCLKAVTGSAAVEARGTGRRVAQQAAGLEKHPQDSLEANIQKMKQRLQSSYRPLIPYVVHMQCIGALDRLLKKLKEKERAALKDSMEAEMQSVIEKFKTTSKTPPPFIVHFFECTSYITALRLQKATRMCPDIPVLLLGRSDGGIKARCCVPQNFVSESFDAQLWMQSVVTSFDGQGFAPRGKDPRLVFSMKGKNVAKAKEAAVISRAVHAATQFAESALNLKQKAQSA